MIESGARARKADTPYDMDMENAPDYLRDMKPGQYTRRKEAAPVGDCYELKCGGHVLAFLQTAWTKAYR